MPTNIIRLLCCGIFDPQDVFVWNGATAAKQYEQERRFAARDLKIRESESREMIRKWNKYKENGEALFLTIKGQIDLLQDHG